MFLQSWLGSSSNWDKLGIVLSKSVTLLMETSFALHYGIVCNLWIFPLRLVAWIHDCVWLGIIILASRSSNIRTHGNWSSRPLMTLLFVLCLINTSFCTFLPTICNLSFLESIACTNSRCTLDLMTSLDFHVSEIINRLISVLGINCTHSSRISSVHFSSWTTRCWSSFSLFFLIICSSILLTSHRILMMEWARIRIDVDIASFIINITWWRWWGHTWCPFYLLLLWLASLHSSTTKTSIILLLKEHRWSRSLIWSQISW